MICSMVAGFFVAHLRLIIPLILSCLSLLFLLDINRFHPEFYIFSCILLMANLYERKKASEENVLLAFRILISAVYIFAGLNKLNDCFFPNVYEPMMRPVKHMLSHGLYSFLMALSWLVPLVEIAIGAALWMPRFKKVTWKLSLFFHGAIIILLLIHNTNYPVFPWNLCMVTFVFILCRMEKQPSIRVLAEKNKLARTALFLFVLVPMSHFINVAGSYISFDVYSGKYGYTYLYVPADMYERLPAHLKVHTRLIDKDHADRKLYIDDWALKEIKVPIYYENRALKNYKKYFEQFSAGQPVQLIVMHDNKEQLVE
ncbi:MAG: MauE/DoxX family redox-associated membrane protein [Bacteroidia bacterium]